MNKRLLRFFIFLFVALNPVLSSAQAVYDAHTTAALISENSSIRPGRPFWVAVHLKTDPHWHTYWQNPGDSGLATKITWELPPGFSAGPILWPYPERIDAAGLTTYGYESEAFLLTQIKPPADIKEPLIMIKARVDWLACEVPCIPGKAEFTLEIPVVAESEDAVVDKDKQKIFAQAFSRVPVQAGYWKIEAFEDSGAIKIKFFPAGSFDARSIEFFPIDSLLIDHTAQQQLDTAAPGVFVLSVPKNQRAAPNTHKNLQGVAVFYAADRSVLKALTIDVPLRPASEPMPVATGTKSSLWFMLLSAFIGGVILNLMPCVFPVLSIKILSFVKHAQNKRALLTSAFAYAAGIVATFTLLALMLIVLREGGEQIGWGFQFQSPYFVVGMAFFLFVIALNMWGFFEWNIPLFLTGHRGMDIKESFFNGILAVVVATPCTAPFMGTAMSFALTQPKSVNLLIFVFLGLGLAFPFVMLCFFPALLKALPKPGVWMDNFKKFLAFPLLATVVWLLWVLAGQRDAMAVIAALMGLLTFSFGLWLFTAFDQRKTLSLLRVFGLACMIGGVLWPIQHIRTAVPESTVTQSSSGKIKWLDFEESHFRNIKDGEITFIDFTARWCLTCQVNKKVALNHPDVVKKFEALGVKAVKADWTNYDASITRVLAELGKNSVPVNVIIYAVDGQRRIKVLPELLTPQIVIEALNTLN